MKRLPLLLTFALFGFLMPCHGASDQPKAQTGSAVKDSGAVKSDGKDVISKIRTQGVLSDENEESLFEEEPPVKAAPSAAANSDSAGRSIASPAVPVDPRSDSLIGENPASASGDANAASAVQSPAAVPAEEITVTAPAKVDSVRSINFARNLKEYKSPRIAMLLSLILPGAGQAYAKEYIWAALFGVVELGVIATSIGFNVKGGNQRKTAYGYADQHYTPSKFNDYYDSLYTYFHMKFTADSALKLDAAQIDSAARETLDGFFLPGEDQSFKDEFNARAGAKSRDYYNYIYDKLYVQGWNDVEPSVNQILTAARSGDSTQRIIQTGGHTYTTHSSPDSGFLLAEGYAGPQNEGVQAIYGYSASWKEYQRLIDVSNGTYKVAQNVLFVLIVNHLVSAIDAGILAKQHNDRLLGKITMWDHIRLEQQSVNTGSEIAPGYALRIKF